MALTVSSNISNDYVGIQYTNTTAFPISDLPEDLLKEVFSNFNLAGLGTSCLVSKNWSKLANTHVLWKNAIYREIAFGNQRWAQYFGEAVVAGENNAEEFSSLPWKAFIEDCQKFNKIFPEKKARDCLMLVRLPKTLNGGLTLKSLGMLAKKYFPYTHEGYRSLFQSDEAKNKPIDKSRWMLMTTDILPGSKNRTYREQEQMVAELAKKSLVGYEVPVSLESVACIFSKYLSSGIRIFNAEFNAWTYTSSKDEFATGSGLRMIVGGFTQDGLDVHPSGLPCTMTGVVALRKEFV